jgi:hypothetical protein
MYVFFHPTCQEFTMHKHHCPPAFLAVGAVVVALATLAAIGTTPAQARERQTQISGTNGKQLTWLR